MHFVVLEGLDGSGKSTQVQMLKQYFDDEGIKYKYLHFPQTHKGVFGDLVARFLRGEFGNNEQVNPYLVALLYAGDRSDAASEIRQWLSDGYLVLVDRYVVSNIAFQCAKIDNGEEVKRLKDWIYNLEYAYYKIPRPDISIFLDAPLDFVETNLINQRQGEDRAYLNGKKDIHEASMFFQQKVRQVYIDQADYDQDTYKISCYTDKNEMLPPEIIFPKIIELLKNNRII
jgi:dTMP kinase